jgi:DNA-binding FrmR family transcriptional regulator
LRSIIGMIETQRPCLDGAQQLHAVENANPQAKKTLIHDHIENCLKQAVGPLWRASSAASSRRSQSISEDCRPWAL